MIERLEGEVESDAIEKAFCDRELSETNTKMADKTAEIDKLSTKIGRTSTRSAQLKGEVAALQNNAELTAGQAEMDKLRRDEHCFLLLRNEGAHRVLCKRQSPQVKKSWDS